MKQASLFLYFCVAPKRSLQSNSKTDHLRYGSSVDARSIFPSGRGMCGSRAESGRLQVCSSQRQHQQLESLCHFLCEVLYFKLLKNLLNALKCETD